MSLSEETEVGEKRETKTDIIAQLIPMGKACTDAWKYHNFQNCQFFLTVTSKQIAKSDLIHSETP